MKLLLFLSCLFIFSCTKDSTRACTEEARSGIEVTVISSITFLPLIEGVTVTVIEGSYSENLTHNTGSNFFTGLFERPGNYTLIVNKEGYTTYSQGNVLIDADECHVITQKVQVYLTPE